ncbi:hypothetical protein [Roseovarius aestuarii]|uniref:Transglutaminase-like domain-containing protein n=1 Tax=Roseovarius aestuarii TaxID=475083 RepID=A0A1X7BL38_9RHOB|nr:hypothetical protein [Roseovarius aestuarii]SMC10361.1 hypothetical protein ROA7745_00167 [Roseovarius aestuarii]
MKIVASFLLLLTFIFNANAVLARSGPPAPGTEQDMAVLAQAILALGPEVSPEEAMRAARVTYSYTYQLAQEYEITDHPLVHNTKVNMGKKKRGLCWHWAHDIEARLKQENFQTLDLHRAIANSFNIRLEHSTAIISRKGDTFQHGIVLDPWRKGGVLFWSPTLEDRRYTWLPRKEVLVKKRELKRNKVKSAGNTRTGGLQSSNR